MASMIITVIGIALFVAISLGGIYYVNDSSVVLRQNEELSKSGFVKLIADYHVYVVNNNESVPVATWDSIVSVPRAPAGMAWSYADQVDGSYFCLSGVIESVGFFNAVAVNIDSGFNSFFINDSCGATDNDTAFIPPASKALTVWVRSDYISLGSGISSVIRNISNENRYHFTVTLINPLTGEEILDGDLITLYHGDDFFIDVEISDDLVTSSLDTIPSNTTTVFTDDVGLNREIKLNAGEEYAMRNFVVSFGDGEDTIIKTFTVESKPAFECDRDLDNIIIDEDDGFEQDGAGYWLLGGAEGYPNTAKAQLLCMVQKQDFGATPDPNILTSNYKLMTDVEFDIDFTVNKTYNASGFLTALSSTINSNNEDWDGDGVIGDVDDDAGWIGFGYDSSNQMIGTFDGNGHTISNVYINGTGAYKGFFSITHPGFVIKNLSIINSYVETDGDEASVLVGEIDDAVIDSCYVSGAVKGVNDVGGFFGTADDVTGASIIKDSYADVDVFATGDNIGGLGGYTTDGSIIARTYALGDVSGYSYVGGLIGFSKGLVSDRISVIDSYTTGNINGDDVGAGGLIGRAVYSDIDDSYSISKINGYSAVGGLVGSMDDSSVVNSYARWSTTPTGTSLVGGAIGYQDAGSSINNTHDYCEYVGSPVSCLDSEVFDIQSTDAYMFTSDGSDDYIDTGLLLSNQAFKLQFKFEGWSNDAAFLGSQDTGDTNRFMVYVPAGNDYIEIYYGNGTTPKITFTSLSNANELIIERVGDLMYATLNGDLQVASVAGLSASASQNIYLYQINNPDATYYNIAAGLIYFDAWVEGVPQLSLQNQVGGNILDLINDTYYNNLGGGGFFIRKYSPWDDSIWYNLGQDSTPALR